MPIVHQLKSGMFMVTLTPNEEPLRKDDECELKICTEEVFINNGGRAAFYDVEYACVLGTLEVIVTRHPDADYPEDVAGILFDEKKELEQSKPGQWKQKWHGFDPKPKCCFCGQKPSLLIILGFNCPGEHSLHCLSSLLRNNTLTDVNFLVRGEQMNAHMAILASASPVMEAMFSKQLAKNISKTVEIADIPAQVFKNLLKFIYTGQVPRIEQSSEAIENLFFVAEKYQIQSLQDICENKLILHLSCQNAIHFLKMALLHCAPKLLDACLEIIQKNVDFFWQSKEWKEIQMNYPNLFFEVSFRLAIKNLE